MTGSREYPIHPVACLLPLSLVSYPEVAAGGIAGIMEQMTDYMQLISGSKYSMYSAMYVPYLTHRA